MLKVFIVDDEAPARRKLRRMVEECEGATVCGEAGSFAEAVAGLETSDADLLLLDVELGDGTGFEVLQGLGEEPGFSVIFCTAYDEYALRAFEVAAIDYLLKPVRQERLAEAVSRARPRRSEVGYAQRLLVERQRAMRFVPVGEIDWIEADRNYLVLHCGGEEAILRGTLESMEKRLDPAAFARANRSAILRVDAIDRLERDEGGGWVAVLKVGDRVAWTRRYWMQSIKKLV